MDDEPLECPNCGHIALLPVRAAEAPGPLLYGCAECGVSYTPTEYWARVPDPIPEEPKSFFGRLMDVFK